eukprot:m.56733 g.56733  ORF g.56733 m.56733 type:complete len:132 (+) comp11058_c0_seq2:207-602(+)
MRNNLFLILFSIGVAFLHSLGGFVILFPYEDRLAKIPENQSQIDNYIYNSVSWWSGTEGWIEALHKMNDARVPYFLEVLRKEIDQTKSSRNVSVLDVGCGGGLVSLELSNSGYTIFLDSKLLSLKFLGCQI